MHCMLDNLLFFLWGDGGGGGGGGREMSDPFFFKKKSSFVVLLADHFLHTASLSFLVFFQSYHQSATRSIPDPYFVWSDLGPSCKFAKS